MDWIERLNRDVTGRLSFLVGSDTVCVEILHWAYSAGLKDNVPHRHTFYEACLVGGYGAGVFSVQNVPSAIAPGDLFLARPGVLHQIRNTEHQSMELCWVSFLLAPSAFERLVWLKQFANSASVCVVPSKTQELAPLWNGALRAVAANDNSSSQTISALSAALIMGILHAATSPFHFSSRKSAPISSDSADRLAQFAVRYIHDNLNRPISVAEVAEQVHLSPRHLTRILEKFTGIAPAAYIERARIDRAATILSRMDTPIKEVAETVGYSTVHHFTRAFTKLQGMPPGAFRRAGGEPVPRDADSEPEGALV